MLDDVLDALPAQIALLDARGTIVSVNDAWRQFAMGGRPEDPGRAVGENYLAVCDGAEGENAEHAWAIAGGIRGVMRSEIEQFQIEYPCRSPAARRWRQLWVKPRKADDEVGAVVIHIDIDDRKVVEDALLANEASVRRLNRVHAVLRGINALMARVRDRVELFEGACQVAVEKGGFPAALIVAVDQATGVPAPIARAGVDDDRMRDIVAALSSSGPSGSAVVRAFAAKTPVVSDDSHNDPMLRSAGYDLVGGARSMAALPLVIADEPVAALILYADAAEFFHECDMALLAELTSDIASAVDHIEQVARAKYLVCFDSVTGLANRRLFQDRIVERMRDAERNGSNFCVAVFDIERFRNVNATFGRDEGDSLLRQVAEWIKQRTGEERRLARVGPDQFAFVTQSFPGENDPGPQMEDHIESFLAKSFQIGADHFRIAGKLGVARFPNDGSDPESLLQNAEAALRKAKASSARYALYHAALSEGAAGRFSMESQMRLALDKAQFVLHYQPKISLANGRLTGAEALIRWNDPQRGLVPPATFLPILEDTGLMHDVGRWALRTVIDDYLSWREAGLPAVRIAVNISRLQLRDRDFVSEIQRNTRLDAAAAAGLELEINESLIMEDVDYSLATLGAIRATGVTVAIDNFGAGSSSLRYLSKLPVDKVKIDRSFVSDMATGPREMSLVTSIISLAHSLRLKVVAEGVETVENLRLLRNRGCDEAQGFLLGKPVAAAAFKAEYLAGGRRHLDVGHPPPVRVSGRTPILSGL